MNKKYIYRDVHLKPTIAKELILKLFSGRTVRRIEIDKTIIQYHVSQGGFPSTAKTSPIKAALKYLNEAGLAENMSKGPGSTWRISEYSNSTHSALG